MTAQLYIFQNHTLEAVQYEGKSWFTAATLAIALEYADARSVTNIYTRNVDEFTPGMSEVIKLVTSGNLQASKRIFSLRGAHLIAMFARTPVAEEFRKWVLDLIDKETTPQATSPIKRRGPYATKQTDLPAGVYHNQSKYNPYRACSWNGKESVHVGSYPTVEAAVQAIDHFNKTGVVQRLQAKRLTQSIEIAPLPAKQNSHPIARADFVNHLKTILEAAQLLSCYEYGKELAWELVAFSQEEAQRFA